jgi:hypothetical protein
MKKTLLTLGAAAVAALSLGAGTASAHSSWHSCSGTHRTTFPNPGYTGIVGYNLHARGKMNCPSARHGFATVWRGMARNGGRGVTSVNDGYVTWVRSSVQRVDYYTWTVTYREFKSGTAFRFTYDFVGD